uniref:Heparan sulfate proteoglycan 2 n=1 Tax=Cyclopterus lumpus TaxID=8103 RepID=A0A8C2WMQ1_CYCLU
MSTQLWKEALVNFTDSLVYGPALEDIFSSAFNEISEAVVDTLESDYNRIPGVQTVSVVLIKEDGVDVFVEMDVGSDYNSNDEQIRSVLYNVVKEGSIASYVTSVQGFQFRRLGEVTAGIRPCMSDEHRCGDGTCILAEYLCDNRPDCRDMSDETNCGEFVLEPKRPTTPPPRPPSPPGPCRADQATCQSGECIPRDYVCDGERDCSDGSDEFRCGTPSPCEPNEFKCRNGRCALKLWRCDGDNDCEDNSDETDCPTKGPGDRCAPEQFECLGDRTCIPASYQCDDEPDCPDRSDEYGCTPPSVTSPPEESIQAARGATVTFTCQAVGVPTPIITWRLNWGHIPLSGRISMTSENGHGTLTIRDVKEADQGAYTCEAINAKGLVFGIPDGVLTLTLNPNSGNCPDGHFSVEGRCVSCFCAGISKNCRSTGRYRNHISLRFTQEEDFKGVNVTYPSRPGTPPLSSTQLLINPEMEEFQLVDLSRRFLNLDSFWTLPRQFLGNKIDSYGGSLKFKVRYTLARGLSEPVEKPDVMLVGNGRRLVYRRGSPTPARVVNQRDIKFTEDKWQHSNGRTVSREELMMTLANLESLSVRTIYDNHMVSVALSDIVMDTTTVEFSILGHAKDVEECRCPPGYSGLSCETCSPGFERVPGGSYLGTCAGCNCNGHASACDPINGHCLSCQHNTEGPQCDKCRRGYFGDPSRGRPDDCKPCPCPYYETSRRFSDTCFLDFDQQPTCDACRPGYTGRRCEKCAPGYQGNPLLPNGRCTPTTPSRDNVAGTVCDECKAGFFHLSENNPEGCLRCFCMGVTKQCASSTWNRDQVRGGVNGQRFSLSNSANTITISEGISQRGSSEVYRSFSGVPKDIYYWVLPESFRGDKVTAYGGELRYTVRFEPFQRSLVIDGQPDVVLQGNGIFLEHHSQTKPLPRVPQTVTVTFRESGWRRSDGQPCTREHLLMALADVNVFMIRATYADNMTYSSLPSLVSHLRCFSMSLQECDKGYTRTSSGLYLGTCERCNCNGHASGCDTETGRCLQCLHNTAGPRCERCETGFYGNPVTDGAQACQPCPCPGTASSNQFSPTCHLESDGQPTCDNCAPSFIFRLFLFQPCNCYNCDQRGGAGCNGGACRCKLNVEGPSCSSCKSGTFHLSQEDKDGCLSCFCMGVTQQCSSSTYYRDLVSSVFSPGNFQGFALVNRQRTNRISTGFTVEVSTQGTQLSYTNFDYLGQERHYWQLPEVYQGDKVGSYGGTFKYSISYVADPRGTLVDDDSVQIIGNDITLVAYQPWKRRQMGSRETNQFEIVFKEVYWHRPDGMPATREHLMMVLADLDDILIRASYSTEMRSSSIFDISMEVAVPNYSGLAQALEVEQCRCPPGYKGLSCQDCAPGYTRTGGGLYLGHCELCECNGHSDSCHPETGICTSCLHNTQGELCEQCASGFFGDPTVGTPEDCQPCACPHNDPDNQFSPTCESLGNGGYQCTACQPGYTGQYCERCAPGYVGNPQERQKCRPYDASLVVKVYPERILSSQGGSVTLRCQVSGSPPHYFYWSREDGRSISSSADRRRQGAELYFPNVQLSDAGVYICTCRDQRSTNRSRAEIIVTSVPSKAIEVTIEEPKAQTVRVGSTINFICTAKSKSPAYTLVWTRMGNGKLPNRAMDFNGILTIQNVQPEDAGVYVCTGSNMFAMDEGNAILYVPASEEAQPVATVTPSVLNVQQGQRAEFRCTVSGNPTAAIEWIGGPGNRMSPRAVVRGGVLTFTAVEPADEGEYTCKALNTHGEHTARVSLLVQKSNPSGLGTQPQVQVSPQNIEAHEGDNLRLYCRATGVPTPKLTWLKNGGQIPPQARMDRTDIGTLLIPNVQMSDSGTYMCVGSNSIGSNSAPIKVSVLKGELTCLSVVSIQPAIADVQEGQNLELNCFAPGNPPPQVSWSKASGRLSSNHQVLGGQLRILSATPEDSGEYICRVKGNHGNPGSRVQQASVSVSVTSSSSRLQSPIIAVEPHSSAVRVGESASFRCRVYSGAQPVRLQWKLANNKPLPDNVKVGPDGSVITITNARPMDHGAYRCVASNPFGITHTIVSLIVKESPVATVTPVGPIHVRVGEPINLECQASGEPRPSVSWHRLDSNRKTMLSSPVPMESNAVMQILVARPEDRGTYVCTARNNEGTTETKVEVIVEGGSQVPTVPRASVPEPLMVVVEGQTATLRCEAHGKDGRKCHLYSLPPPTITWSKLRSPLPWRHNLENNSLVLPTVGRQDSGEYICTATNNMGTSEVTIMLDVESESSPLAVRVSPQVEVKAQGSAVEFTCSSAGGIETKVEWLKEGGALPPNHHVKDGVLRIENLEQSNEGVYICRASSVYGQAQDTARLTIQALPKVMINVRTSVQTVMIGNSVEFECQAVGDPEPTVKWSKVGGSLPAHIMVKDGMLRIEKVTEADAGQYRCTATNDVGSVQSQVVLNVQSLPQIAALPETKEVTVGSDAVLPCVASGYPLPAIKWSKLEEELPPKCFQELNALTVPRVTHEDSGIYVCTASNKQGKVEAFTTLQVHERVMPYFAQEPLSFLTLPTIKNAYKAFSIKINFRPDNVDGMILYNGQRRTTGADFISLGLVGGRLEFRFDVGSGMATIRDPNPVKLGEFHTVELYRNHTLGYIIVDGGEPINGSSQGKFQGLDLNEELHVGGYPNYTVLAKTAGIKTGFVGCIRQLVIQGEEVIFKDLDRSSTGVTNCPTCKDHPCQNGGRCEDSEASLYKCGCPRGFTGSNCQHHSSLHCHSEACGPDATCINRQNVLGYDCRCHLGKSGNKCMDGELVTIPLFDGEESYIAYPPLTNVHDDLRVELEFKPLERDGLMFFCGGKKIQVEDFVAISMVEGHVEFRYELGTGQAILLSPEPVTLGQWHRVVAEQNKKAGHLKVDQGPVEKKTSPGKSQGLNIHTPMYLGGVPNMDILPKPANVSELFEGCIGEVSINNKKVDLSYSFTESRSIRQCVDNSPCDHRPCLNGGHCMSSVEYEYQCLCEDGFEGERCEVVKDACQSNLQCQNGGSCVNGQCVCAPAIYPAHTGQVSSFPEALRNLESSEANDSPYQYAAHFSDDGYIALPKSVFPRSAHHSPETIELEINTGSSEGLILWQGVELGEHGKGKDFISLSLQNGHLVFSYQLGSGEAKILSRRTVNDGRWHTVTAVRTGKDGYIQIDGGTALHGQSKGRSLMVNTKGSIYLGGAPDMAAMTGGKFLSGMTGCVRNLALMNAWPGQQPAQAIDLQTHGAHGINVLPCSS